MRGKKRRGKRRRRSARKQRDSALVVTAVVVVVVVVALLRLRARKAAICPLCVFLRTQAGQKPVQRYAVQIALCARAFKPPAVPACLRGGHGDGGVVERRGEGTRTRLWRTDGVIVRHQREQRRADLVQGLGTACVCVCALSLSTPQPPAQTAVSPCLSVCVSVSVLSLSLHRNLLPRQL